MRHVEHVAIAIFKCMQADCNVMFIQGMGPGRGEGERGQGYRKLWQQVPCLCCHSMLPAPTPIVTPSSAVSSTWISKVGRAHISSAEASINECLSQQRSGLSRSALAQAMLQQRLKCFTHTTIKV